MICTYSEDFFMADFFSLRARGFITTVFVSGGGFTPADGEVPTTATFTTPAEVVDGSVPAISAHELLEHHPQRIQSRSPFGAWGRVEKPRDCKTDNVSMQQL
jgi:hypothetical protein